MYKYRLSLMDHCDKLAVDRRTRRQVLSTQLTDDGPVYHAVNIHPCRANSLAHFNDRYRSDRNEFSKYGV